LARKSDLFEYVKKIVPLDLVKLFEKDLFTKLEISKFILLFPILFIASSCNFNSNARLTKITDHEYISLIESFKVPELKDLVVRDVDRNIIPLDSLQTFKNPDSYALDYYQNKDGEIIEGILRAKTLEDEKVMDKIFKIDLEAKEVEEIENLKRIEQKNNFLMNLWESDQKIRDGTGQELISKFGYKSDEHNAYRAKAIKTDKRIFLKLKTYLEIHSYPQNKEEYHWKAINAFPIIIGHNSNYKEQEAILNHLIESYKKGYCDKGELIWVLGEMYESKNRGKRYEMKSKVFTPEQEFQELSEALNIKID